MTYDGRKLHFPIAKPQELYKATFPRERRFMGYYLTEKRSNAAVGPTTYSPSNYIEKYRKIPCLVTLVVCYWHSIEKELQNKE